MMPTSGSPKKNSTNNSTNGVLRNSSTYRVPTNRNGGTGLTRNVATTSPITEASAHDHRVKLTVVRRPSPQRSRLSAMTSNIARFPGSVPVHRRRLGNVIDDGADRLLERRRPVAVVGDLLEHVVDEVAQRLVALLQPDAVGL